MSNAVEFSIIGKDRFSKAMGKARASIDTTVKSMLAIGATASIAMGIAAKSIIDVGSETENLRIRMTAMLGGVAEGNQLFEDMATFAGEVPFAYEEIMNSATQLSGIMKGGVDEINQWMPMIADLAAVSGLSIETTTEQIVRMYSAGAGAADLFRERGITSMLGFEAGVSISAEDTRKKLVEAFEDPASKFRGAAGEMATTWTGIMSMISDKWFSMRTQLADAGLFNFFKAIAITIDTEIGKALDTTKANAVSWSNTIIDGIRAIFDAVGFLADMFRGLEVVWAGLDVAFARVAEGIFIGINKMAESMRFWMNMIPGINISKFTFLEGTLERATARSDELGKKLQETLAIPMPSDTIKNFVAQVEESFVMLQEKTAASQAAIIEGEKKITVETLSEFDKRVSSLLSAKEKEIEIQTTWAEGFTDIFNTTMESIFINAQTIGEATSEIITTAYDQLTAGIGQSIGDAIVFGKDLGDAMKALLKRVAANIIGMFIQMQIQRFIMAGIFGAASATEAQAALTSSFAQSYSNAFAATAIIPVIGPALAPGVAAAALTAVTAGTVGAAALGGSTGLGLGVAGIAHGGLTNVPNRPPSESTYLLTGGERVLSPNQNKDFTNFIDGGAGSGAGSAVIIESIFISINTAAASFEDIEDEELTTFVADKIIPAIDDLDRSGVKIEAIERGNL